jgi:hypothetical protein
VRRPLPFPRRPEAGDVDITIALGATRHVITLNPERIAARVLAALQDQPEQRAGVIRRLEQFLGREPPADGPR